MGRRVSPAGLGMGCAKRVSLRGVADGTRVPMAVLLGIHEGTVTDVSPVHLRALARSFFVEEEEGLVMAPQAQPSAMNHDAVTGIAASTADDLTDDERRQVEELIRGIRRQRREKGDGGRDAGRS